MDPVDRYLSELASRLPRRKRQNVLAELRRNLHDRVEELSHEGVTPEVAAERAVIELGDPNELAAEYGGGRIIIPATRYHLFKGAVILLTSVHLLATMVTTALDVDLTFLFVRLPSLRGWALPQVLWVLATHLLADIGLVALFFWWAELSLPRQFTGLSVRARMAEAKPRWSGLAGPLVMLGILNVWRNEVFALYTTGAEGWISVPILRDTFVQSYLWPINVTLLLALGVHTYKIIGGPTALAAGAELVYRVVVFVLTGALLGVGQPFNWPQGQIEAVEIALTALFRLGLLAALFGNAFALYRSGARLWDRLS